MGGWADADFDKPVITVAAPYTNASSCNHQFDQLAKAIADAVEEAGGKFLPCRKFAKSAEANHVARVPTDRQAIHLLPASDYRRHDDGSRRHEIFSSV